jgi:hypothetical protein
MNSADPWKDENQINFNSGAELIKYKLLFFGLISFLLSIYLPFISLDEMSASISEQYSTAELLFISSILLIGVYTAYTGANVVIAKIIAIFILVVTAYQVIDLYREVDSELGELLRMFGIDISSIRGWRKLTKYIGLAFYLYIASLILLIFAMLGRRRSVEYSAIASESESENILNDHKIGDKMHDASKKAQDNANKLVDFIKIQYGDLKLKWNSIEYVSVISVSVMVEECRSALKKSEFQLAVKSLWNFVTPYIIRVATWASVTFSTNIIGKVIVISLLLAIYFVLF